MSAGASDCPCLAPLSISDKLLWLGWGTLIDSLATVMGGRQDLTVLPVPYGAGTSSKEPEEWVERECEVHMVPAYNYHCLLQRPG